MVVDTSRVSPGQEDGSAAKVLLIGRFAVLAAAEYAGQLKQAAERASRVDLRH